LKGSQVADVQVALARTIEGQGDVQQAAAYYTQAVQNDPTRADAWARLAVLADKDGMFAVSDEYHSRALALQPNNPDFHCNRGYSLYLQSRWVEAEATLRNAILLKADHRRAHNNLGLTLARTGRGDEALVCFRNAGCAATEAHTNLAYGLTLSGDLAGARHQYELALKLSPNSDLVRGRLEQVNVLSAKLGPTQEPPTWNPVRRPAPDVVPAAATSLELAPVPSRAAGQVEPGP
jgi:Flp pilus assembly protein TadD